MLASLIPRQMMHIRTLLLVGILAMSFCGGKSPHPGKSIGIEGHAGVKDLYHVAESHRKKHDLPALGVGIVRGGKIIGLGMAGRFVDFHIQGANGNGKLLSRDSFTRLHAPPEKQQYALGWEVEIERDGHGKSLYRSIYHGGSR